MVTFQTIHGGGPKGGECKYLFRQTIIFFTENNVKNYKKG